MEAASSHSTLTESQSLVLEQWRGMAGGSDMPRASRIRLDHKPWAALPVGMIETLREASKLKFQMGPTSAALVELLGKIGKLSVPSIEGIRLGLVEVTALRRPRTLPVKLDLADGPLACEFLLLPLSQDGHQVDAILYHINLMVPGRDDQRPTARSGQGGLFDAKSNVFFAA